MHLLSTIQPHGMNLKLWKTWNSGKQEIRNLVYSPFQDKKIGKNKKTEKTSTANKIQHSENRLQSQKQKLKSWRKCCRWLWKMWKKWKADKDGSGTWKRRSWERRWRRPRRKEEGRERKNPGRVQRLWGEVHGGNLPRTDWMAHAVIDRDNRHSLSNSVNFTFYLHHQSNNFHPQFCPISPSPFFTKYFTFLQFHFFTKFHQNFLQKNLYEPTCTHISCSADENILLKLYGTEHNKPTRTAVHSVVVSFILI